MQKIEIFISEKQNLENLFLLIEREVPDFTESKKNKLKEKILQVFSKTHNNKVGYYLSHNTQDNYYLKIYIFPKTIPLPSSDKKSKELAIRSLVEYIKQYYRLGSTYPKYNENLYIKSNQEFAFDVLSSLNSAQSIEEFAFYKYKTILARIQSFFLKHKSFKRVKNKYCSQTIKHKIDLTKNIKEINKTIIHQERYSELVYSKLATVVYGATRLFVKKINFLEEEQKKKIIFLIKSIDSLLIKKYKVNSRFSLTKNQLLSERTYRVFKKKHSYRKLYIDLLTLFGMENFFDEEVNKDIRLDIEAEALFIKPDLLYEWYAYDYIINNCHLDNIKYEIKYDKNEGTNQEYHLKKNSAIEKIGSSPDLIIFSKEDKRAYIIDAKWKILEHKIPDLNDILKIKRDCEVRSREYTVYAILAYPKAEESFFSEHLYNNKFETFSFYTKTISLNKEIPCNISLEKMLPAILSNH